MTNHSHNGGDDTQRPVLLRLPEGLLAELDRCAERDGRSRNRQACTWLQERVEIERADETEEATTTS